MTMVCVKCSYCRKPTDTAPDYECPKCGVIYAKAEAALRGRQTAHPHDAPQSNIYVDGAGGSGLTSTRVNEIKKTVLLVFIGVAIGGGAIWAVVKPSPPTDSKQSNGVAVVRSQPSEAQKSIPTSGQASNKVISPAARKAFEAIQGVKYKLEVGVSYLDYGKILADAAIPVRSYLDSKDAQENERLARMIQYAWLYYNDAFAVWKVKIDDGPYIRNQDAFKSIIYRAPRVAEFEFGETNYLNIDKVINRLFEAAGEKLTEIKDVIAPV